MSKDAELILRINHGGKLNCECLTKSLPRRHTIFNLHLQQTSLHRKLPNWGISYVSGDALHPTKCFYNFFDRINIPKIFSHTITYSIYMYIPPPQNGNFHLYFCTSTGVDHFDTITELISTPSGHFHRKKVPDQFALHFSVDFWRRVTTEVIPATSDLFVSPSHRWPGLACANTN